jgi:hypothetical protein
MPAPIVVSSREGGRALREGRSINLEVPARIFPALGAFCAELARELGADTGTSSIFLGPPGRNLRPHTDPVEVVSFQLQGRKRWYLGASALSRVSELSALPDLGACADPGAELRRRGRTVEARPGSVLFIPRDVWHATEDLVGQETDDRSISLSVAIRGASWATHAARAVTDMVSADPRWTRAMFKPASTAAERQALREAAVRRCSELREAIRTEPLLADLLPSEGLPREQDRFRTARGWSLALVDGADGAVLRVSSGDEVALVLDVEPLVRDVFLALVRSEDWITFATLLGLTDATTRARLYLQRVLTMIYEAGALEWR